VAFYAAANLCVALRYTFVALVVKEICFVTY
jgi:hypothetical protein